MGELTRYRQFITQILADYTEFLSGDPAFEPLLVIDDRHDHYMILFVGWRNQDRERELRIHVFVRLIGSKFWIEEDGTEFGIAQRLIDVGVPKADIVLAFQTPAERRYGTFALA